MIPRVSLITRKSFGGAYIGMNSRALGATAVFAWPHAEVAVMGASAAVGILHRKRLAAAPPGERERLHGSARRTVGRLSLAHRAHARLRLNCPSAAEPPSGTV